MVTVAGFYRFTRFEDPAALRPGLLSLCRKAGVRGTVLLAHEGINATIAGPREAIAAVIGHVRGLPGCAGMDWQESTAEAMPFGRIKVRLKREIVTLGRDGVDPSVSVGRYVAPGEWNALIRSPDVAVIDTRNAYEVAIGSFEGALDPGLGRFGEFPDWWAANRDRLEGKRIAMFCTGGIRCEKATSWLLGQGVGDVCHLKGGILGYLNEVPEAESLWHGGCFVFDGRVSVTHGLCGGGHVLCHACRRPLGAEDVARPDYEAGVACHRCRPETSELDRARFRERQRQMRLAEARGTPHLGTATAFDRG